jgi:hypothetical protein
VPRARNKRGQPGTDQGAPDGEHQEAGRRHGAAGTWTYGRGTEARLYGVAGGIPEPVWGTPTV